MSRVGAQGGAGSARRGGGQGLHFRKLIINTRNSSRLKKQQPGSAGVGYGNNYGSTVSGLRLKGKRGGGGAMTSYVISRNADHQIMWRDPGALHQSNGSRVPLDFVASYVNYGSGFCGLLPLVDKRVGP